MIEAVAHDHHHYAGEDQMSNAVLGGSYWVPSGDVSPQLRCTFVGTTGVQPDIFMPNPPGGTPVPAYYCDDSLVNASLLSPNVFPAFGAITGLPAFYTGAAPGSPVLFQFSRQGKLGTEIYTSTSEGTTNGLTVGGTTWITARRLSDFSQVLLLISATTNIVQYLGIPQPNNVNPVIMSGAVTLPHDPLPVSGTVTATVAPNPLPVILPHDPLPVTGTVTADVSPNPLPVTLPHDPLPVSGTVTADVSPNPLPVTVSGPITTADVTLVAIGPGILPLPVQQPKEPYTPSNGEGGLP